MQLSHLIRNIALTAFLGWSAGSGAAGPDHYGDKYGTPAPNESLTPHSITIAAALNAANQVQLTQEKSDGCSALQANKDIFVNGCDTYIEWKYPKACQFELDLENYEHPTEHHKNFDFRWINSDRPDETGYSYRKIHDFHRFLAKHKYGLMLKCDGHQGSFDPAIDNRG